jgi:hypothetical protein
VSGPYAMSTMGQSPHLTDGVTVELDGQRPPDELANAVKELMRVTR